MKTLHIILFFLLFIGLNNACYSQKYSLKITSKDSLENSFLKKINYSKNKISLKSIPAKIDSITSQLEKLGFLNTQIISKTKKDSTFIVGYKLNQQIKNIVIRINPDNLTTEFLKTNQLELIDNTIKIKFTELTSFMNKFTSFYEQKGYSFNKIKLSDYKIGKETLFAKLNIDKNSSRKINNIVVKGYEKFPKKHISYNLKKSINNTFNKNSIEQLYKDLSSIPFIKQTKKPEVLFLKDSTLIYIYLKKRKISQFDGLIGFTSNEDSKLVFSGHLNLKLNNLFNKGESFEILWKSNEDKNKYLNLNIDIPYVFNTRLNPKINFSIYNQDSSYVNIQTKASLNFILNNKHKIGVLTSSENSNNLLQTNTQNIVDYKTNLYGIAYENKTNSTSIFYKNKQLFNLILKHGLKKTNSNKDNKTEIVLNLNYLIELNKRLILYLNNNTSINISDNILTNELYKIGGANSIRGFSDKSITSSKYSILTTDVNYKLNNKTYLYSILDYGYTYKKKTNNLISLGLGYKTKLKSSILNINYCLGKTLNTPFDLKKAQLNINFINYF